MARRLQFADSCFRPMVEVEHMMHVLDLILIGTEKAKDSKIERKMAGAGETQAGGNRRAG